MPAGAEVALEVPLPALPLGTTQPLQLDMVEEGVAWFESRGDIPLQLAVTPVLEDEGGDTDGGGGDSTGGGETTSGGQGSSGSGAASTSPPGMGDMGTGSEGASESADDGCGCSQASTPPWGLALLLLGLQAKAAVDVV